MLHVRTYAVWDLAVSLDLICGSKSQTRTLVMMVNLNSPWQSHQTYLDQQYRKMAIDQASRNIRILHEGVVLNY